MQGGLRVTDVLEWRRERARDRPEERRANFSLLGDQVVGQFYMQGDEQSTRAVTDVTGRPIQNHSPQVWQSCMHRPVECKIILLVSQCYVSQ